MRGTSRRAPPPSPRSCARRLRHVRGRQVAPRPDGASARPPARTTSGRCRGASTASTASSRARPTSSTRSSPPTTTPSTRPAGPRTATTCSEDLVDQLDRTGSATPSRSGPTGPFFLYLAFGATHAPHQAPRRVPRRSTAAVRRGLGRCPRAVVRAPGRAGPRPRGHQLAPRNPGVDRGTTCPRTSSALRRPAAGGVRRVPRPHRRPDRPPRRRARSSWASSTTRCSWSCPTTAPARRAGRSASCTR